MDQNLKVGDIVLLKSGGPAMTIQRIGDFSAFGTGGKTQAECVWFDGRKALSQVFQLDTFKLEE